MYDDVYHKGVKIGTRIKPFLYGTLNGINLDLNEDELKPCLCGNKPVLIRDGMLNLAYSTNSKEICQYIADLLKELKERRKMPEVVFCKDCKAIYCDFCLKTLKPVNKEKDYCSLAERRTDEAKRSD